MNKRTGKFPVPKRDVGRELLAALTEEQTVAVIDAMVRFLRNEGIERLQSAVDDETAAVLAQVFKPFRAESPVRPSDSKFTDQWRKAWDHWHDAVADLGDEDGPYMYQEHHWEEPYFDGSAFADRLDEAADAVLPLIERACGLRVEEDDFFQEELLAIDEGIGDFPDGLVNDGCELGPDATSCYLQWEWRINGQGGNSPKKFLVKIGSVQELLLRTSLDSKTFIDFFTSLPAERRKAIHHALQELKDEPPWKDRLVSTYSDWQKIERGLLARHDRKAFLLDSMARLKDDWTLGIPVIGHVVARKDFTRADEVLIETIAGLSTSRRVRKPWSAHTELLADHIGYWSEADDKNIVKLLSSPAARHAGILLEKWKTRMAEKSFPDSTTMRGTADTWVHDLIDACVHEAKGPKWFKSRLGSRLKKLADTPGGFTMVRRGELIVLIDDLSGFLPLARTYPRLARVVKDEMERKGPTEYAKARRSWLRRMDVASVLPVLFTAVTRNVRKIVPDPALAYGSRYDEEAAWCGAVREIDAEAFE